MPRNHGKLKIQWIEENAQRNATFRKRRATLLEKARELSILCQVPVAMVVYGPGNNASEPPACFPEDPEAARGIMRKYLELPEASKDTHRLDNEGFLRRCLTKMGKRLESYRATSRQLQVNLVLNDVSLGRRRSLDGLAPELAAAVRAELDLLRSSINERVHALTTAMAAPPPALAPEQAAAAVLVSSQEEPLMVAPLAMAPPPQFVLPPPPLEPEVLLVPPQEPLVAPAQEPPMVPPFAMAPPAFGDNLPVLVHVPHTLLPAPLHSVGDPPAATVGEGVDVDEDDGFPRNGSYLLEVADAILDDGSVPAVQATEQDVDRLLREHGLESFIKPKP